MIFTARIEKLLGANHIKEVIDEFLKFLNDIPQSNRDARNDANQLRGQIIILSGRFTDLNAKMNTNTIDPATANQEKSAIINSFIQILNQLPSNYPDLNSYLDEKNEDDEWNDAQDKNIIEAYQVYFSKYPNGKYKAETIKLITELEEVKLKQDMEIKRLALLEKERRENDKAAASESQKTHTPVPEHLKYGTGGVVNTTPPSKARKGLYIGLGILIGIIVLIVIALAVSKNETPSTVNNTSPSTPAVEESNSGISESVKAELISAIRLGNSVQIGAYFSLNAAELNKSFIGEALKTGLSEIEYLRSNDLFMTATLESQEFVGFKLSASGREAEVELDETWSAMYSRISTQLCVSRTASTRLPQTMFLKKSDFGWMISSIVQKNTATPQMLPCDNTTN